MYNGFYNFKIERGIYMNCKKCGTFLPEGSSFCPACGSKAEAFTTQKVDKKNMIESFKSFSILKKTLTIGILAIVLFFAYAILSPEDKAIANKPAPTPAAAVTPAAATTKVKNGFFKVTDKDGSTYEGNYVNDVRQGKGTRISSTGIKYVGDFFDGSLNGKGVITFPNGDIYEGSVVKNLRDGSGKYTSAAGGYYNGMWKTDVKSGYGVSQFTNGNVYEGNFVNNLPHDTKGKMKFKDGTSYEGAFSSGKMTGQGTRYYSNGIYTGSFVDGVLDGYGTYEWESGNSYEGYWKNGQRNGQGTFYYSNGTSDFGTWKDDKLVAAG